MEGQPGISMVPICKLLTGSIKGENGADAERKGERNWRGQTAITSQFYVTNTGPTHIYVKK